MLLMDLVLRDMMSCNSTCLKPSLSGVDDGSAEAQYKTDYILTHHLKHQSLFTGQVVTPWRPAE